MKLFTVIFTLCVLPALAQQPEVVKAYIANYEQYAIEEQIRTGIPAAITMAQAIHESGAGYGDLALKSNNHFGIKCKTGWAGDRVFHDDDESGECFRAYGSVGDSFRDHSDFLKTSKRYTFLFDLDPTDYEGWANGLKLAGYATNPKYPRLLIKIIEENNLESLTKTAIAKASLDKVYITTASTTALDETDITAPREEKKNASRQEPIAIAKTEESNKLARTVNNNHCRAILVSAGTSLRALAKQEKIDYADLLEYNDMKPLDKLVSDQLIYLEPKRKKGKNKSYTVQKGDSAWLISQLEGMRLEKLLQYNDLAYTSVLKPGQVLSLKGRTRR